jgi:hypothetical protein
MARKKRLFTYEFADGEVEVSSSYKARCNVTGEMIPIYHKFLEKLVKKQYKNNFALFLKTFAKKGAIQKQREEQGYKDDDKFSLNAYSDYLIICYKSCINILDGNFNKEAIIKTKNEMSMLEDNFTRNFNRDIKKFL